MYFCNMIFRHLLNMRSHPTWVRELKLSVASGFGSTSKSHPTWVRELKPAGSLDVTIFQRRTLRGCVN